MDVWCVWDSVPVRSSDCATDCAVIFPDAFTQHASFYSHFDLPRACKKLLRQRQLSRDSFPSSTGYVKQINGFLLEWCPFPFYLTHLCYLYSLYLYWTSYLKYTDIKCIKHYLHALSFLNFFYAFFIYLQVFCITQQGRSSLALNVSKYEKTAAVAWHFEIKYTFISLHMCAIKNNYLVKCSIKMFKVCGQGILKATIVLYYNITVC